MMTVMTVAKPQSSNDLTSPKKIYTSLSLNSTKDNQKLWDTLAKLIGNTTIHVAEASVSKMKMIGLSSASDTLATRMILPLANISKSSRSTGSQWERAIYKMALSAIEALAI
jgi:hypothetical protein